MPFFPLQRILFILVIAFLELYQLSCLEAPLYAAMFMVDENVFNMNFYFLSQFIQTFVSVIIYHIPPIIIKLEGTFFGAFIFLCLSVTHNTKDVLRKNFTFEKVIGRRCPGTGMEK